MTDLATGIKHIRDDVNTQVVAPAEMSVIGLIGTAGAADDTAFPENTPVYLATNDSALRTLLGADGTIPQALAGISAQLDTEAAKVVIVRVDEGDDAQEAIANIVGSEAEHTGIWAFLDAPEELGLTPRLIIAPGYTSQTVSGIASTHITAPGTGGTNGTFALAFTGGTGSGAAGNFTVAGGVLTNITITNGGSYTVAPTLSFVASTGLTGATATVTLEQLANGVVAAIPTILDRLDAMFLPEGPSSSRQDWLDWLETVPASARIIHPLRQDAKILDADGDTITAPLSPFVIGIYVRRDSDNDGIPSGSAANQPINGLVGVTPTIRLSLTDADSEGQADIAAHGGIVVRGEAGVEAAAGSGGFAFWGFDTLASDTAWQFVTVNRMRDMIELAQVQAEKFYLGKFNITVQTVQAIINTIDTQLADLAAGGHILPSYKVYFEPDKNNPTDLRAGSVTISFACEEPPVLKKITIYSRRYATALTDLVQTISTQLGSGQSS